VAAKNIPAAKAWFLGAAVIAGAAGELSEFHFLGHATLAFSIVAWLSASLWQAVWLVTALAGVVCLRPFRKNPAKT
jgi:hypothetical protein